MTLRQIETILCGLIGFDRYADLSVDTDPSKIADFALLHDCVNLAREEVKMNSSMPALLIYGAVINIAANLNQYSLPADFDIPTTLYYSTTAGQLGTKLTRLFPENLPATVSLTDTDTPSSYIISGTSANRIQIYLLPIPSAAGFLIPIYKPVLTALSLATAEDIIMLKYPKTVIDFATAIAFQIIKKDQAQYDKYYAYGLASCRKIDLRENSADDNPQTNIDTLIANRRKGRTTI